MSRTLHDTDYVPATLRSQDDMSGSHHFDFKSEIASRGLAEAGPSLETTIVIVPQ